MGLALGAEIEIHKHDWIWSCHGTSATTCESQYHEIALGKAAVLPAHKASKTLEQTVPYLPGTQCSLPSSSLDSKFQKRWDSG